MSAGNIDSGSSENFPRHVAADRDPRDPGGTLDVQGAGQRRVAAAEIARAMKRNPNGTPASLFGYAADLIAMD